MTSPEPVGLSGVEWARCVVEPHHDRELEWAARRKEGVVPHGLPYLAAVPWLVRSLLINPSDGLLVHTRPDLSERIWLAISQDNSCRYCYAAHRALLRLVGLSEERLRHVEQDLAATDLDPSERLAVQFARRVGRSNPLPTGADKKPLRDAGFGEDAIKELAYLASFVSAANRVATLPAIPPEPMETLPERPLYRLFGPLIRRRLASRRKPARPAPLAPELKEGPYSYLVLALDGLPVARLLRLAIDAGLASPVLERRAKLLVFAVVAHGLGCAFSQRETARLLAECGLDEARLAPILAHLGSPDLDPIESAILPVARDTLWYRPLPIQRRAQTLSDEIGSERFLEFVGVASLANMVCRLGIILDVP